MSFCIQRKMFSVPILHFTFSLFSCFVDMIILFDVPCAKNGLSTEQLVSEMTIQIEIVMQNVYPKLHLVYLFNRKLHLTKINSNHG